MNHIEIPKKYFLVKGRGDAEYPLNAFDIALLDAGVGNTNLIRLSSILPPKSQEVSSPVQFQLGQLITLAYASYSGTTKGEYIAAAVAVAIPEDDSFNGLIMEHAGPGTEEEIEGIVIKKAELGMKYRNYKIKEIKSIAIQHTIKDSGAVFAACVLV